MNDCLILLCDHTTEEIDATVADDKHDDPVVLNFHMSGVSSYLPVHLLTET